MPTLDLSLPVLVIDPTERISPVLKRMLAEIGVRTVETVPNAVEALTALRSKPVGLVMTDWAMEPMGGDEFVRTVRADPNLEEIPVVVVTVEANPRQLMEAWQAGVDGYALAPFSTRVLAAKLDEIAAAA